MKEEVLDYARLLVWSFALLHCSTKANLINYSKGGGPGVCETLCLVTCYAAMNLSLFINCSEGGGPEVCKTLIMVTCICCNG